MTETSTPAARPAASHTSHRRRALVPAGDLAAGDRVNRDGRMMYVVHVVHYGNTNGARVFLNDLGAPSPSPARIECSDLRVDTFATMRWSANRQIVRPGVQVVFADGAMPSCDGVTFTVDHLSWDNTQESPRLIAWLTRTDDMDRAPSRRRGRSAYVDTLRLSD